MYTPRAWCSSRLKYRGSLPRMNENGPETTGARLLNFVHGVRRFELHPIDACDLFIGLQPLQAVLQAAVGRIARIALGHDDEIGIELVLHVHGGAIPHQGLLQRHHFHPGVLRAPLALNGLVVNADAGQAGTNSIRQPADARP